MSGVYIKGMEMPTSCSRCALFDEGSNGDPDWCNVMHQVPEYETCPLVEIPPHGRLIDADALEYEEAYLNGHYELGDVEIVTRKDIESAPTIITAEETKE